MSDTIIKVENISKRYRLGMKEERAESLFGAFTSFLKSPVSRFKKLKSLTSFDQENADDILWALKDVSFEVKRGEVLGIIGKNGAGKSTLLKVLAQITEPSSGRIDMYGRVASLLEVGTGFHNELTGRENVYLNGTILGMTKKEIDRKFDEIVEFSGISKFIDTPVKRYSSGMKVRLAFSVAAHLDPEILLIDEVLAVGDAEFQKKCLGKMDDVAKSGRTVLFVSHNMTAVKELCQKGIMLKNGQVYRSGEMSGVISYYLNDNSGELLQKKWEDISEAPGNESIKLTEAIIEKDSEKISMSSSFVVKFSVFFNDDVDEFGTTFHLLNEYNSIVFGAGINEPIRNYKKGFSYNFKFIIPGDLLNSGNYSINLLMVSNARALHIEKDILKFEVIDDTKRAGWLGKLAGVVRPKIEYSINEI